MKTLLIISSFLFIPLAGLAQSSNPTDPSHYRDTAAQRTGAPTIQRDEEEASFKSTLPENVPGLGGKPGTEQAHRCSKQKDDKCRQDGSR